MDRGSDGNTNSDTDRPTGWADREREGEEQTQHDKASSKGANTMKPASKRTLKQRSLFSQTAIAIASVAKLTTHTSAKKQGSSRNKDQVTHT